MAFVELDGIVKDFSVGGGRLRVLDGLSLKIEAGEGVGLYGVSGSGKSTLLHLIGGLDRPTSGQVRFEGVDLALRSEDDLASYRLVKIGFVFQFHHILDEFSALENVMLPLLIRGISWSKARDEASGWLERFGLTPRARHRPLALSGGEKGRVALARALVGRPRLLLADEPTGNLDPQAAGEVAGLLEDLNRKDGMTMLVVSHNPEIVRRFGRRLELVGGRLEER